MLADIFVKINNAAGKAGLWVSSLLLVYIVAHISVEIVMRSFFDASTYSMDEFVGYSIGAMTFLSMSHTLRSRRHVRVSILQSLVKGRAAIAVELICLALTFGVALFLARYIWRTLARDFTRGTVSPSIMETPIWIIDAAIFTGLALFMMQILASGYLTARDGMPRGRESQYE